MMPEQLKTESALVRAMQKGDEAALGQVIDLYTSYVGAIVWNIVQGKLDRSDAAAVISDVFFTLWTNSDKIRHGRLKGYLCSIARSKALNALRGCTPALPLEEDMVQICSPLPEEELEREEEYAALRRALDKMPEPDRSIFLRRYYLYQKIPDIAAEMQLNVNTVQTKLRRGRDRLRLELEKGGF